MLEPRRAGSFAAPEAFFNAAPCGLHSVDAEGRFLAVNDTELKWLGYAREELLGLGMAEVLPVETLAGFEQRFSTLRRRGGAVDMELPLVRRNGTRFPALLTFSALRDEAGRFIKALVAVCDLTERKRHELEQSARAREQSQREFVANVSHEFRTPLAAILGFTETLREGGMESPRDRDRFLATIENQAKRLLHLVDEVLDISARDAGVSPPRLEDVELRDEVRRAARALGPAARKRRVTMVTRVPAALRARADRGQLERMLHNLLANAVKYNRRGGRVTIEARRSGPMIELGVRDTGIGIAEDELPLVFERFHRSRDPRARGRKGSGLGLAISKAIVLAHGGRIWVDSVPGRGARFRLTLPAARRPN